MPEKSINYDAIKELKKINWTSNLRELRNVIEWLIILCDKEIKGEDVKKLAASIKIIDIQQFN